jgi:hypothetical protein
MTRLRKRSLSVFFILLMQFEQVLYELSIMRS